MDVSAIIVAAGKSTRANGVDKNFVKINGKFVVEFSIGVFLKVDEIKEIILVLNDDNFEKGKNLANKYKNLSLIKGGETRAVSVKNGVEIAKGERVLVHDGARPFINRELVVRILENLKNFDCVIPAVPVRHTIKEVENGFVKKTFDRTKLFEVQTPEGFRKDLLIQLYKNSILDDSIFDESILFERANIPVKVVDGLYENFKITTPLDIFLAEIFSRTWKQE
ncbi:2-C-methyl-D-erythritol 4-phosphate cytidylyltransferase [Caldisericum exile]|uniref:2-C-methyl-D-erythritol 4-phosphate cytidylyltransferase n=1 Tax=Caldisericum exile (strain DSM 21853 / NBRC 104410 / AZM16c01) TaxID=511051 RepID=A0A7U6GFC8_CALEA|nr:2-C-methyl-D-erythritol 4-phosphate cytidylyltransferase [Caldisericum exile]BAL81370.1 2-C-methyl-D-erythritol 4-phosphate cytidylyltransferase [Caldisericum exile AZM16c01]